MALRLLREGILTSERIDQLDAPAEVFYRRLMSKVDDYGLFDARLSILRTSLYPLRVDRVREADIARWIAACEKAGVIALYTFESKPYLQMRDTRWQARSEPKWPLPPWGKSEPPSTAESGCEQLLSTDVQPKAVAQVFVFGDEGGDVSSASRGSDPEGFAAFWSAWPSTERKADRKKCAAKWAKEKLHQHLPAILANIEALKGTKKWRDGFEPAPYTYLNGERWKDGVSVDAASTPQAVIPGLDV